MIRDIEKRRAYYRAWMHERRAEFFSGKSCEQCGFAENLVIHHRNPETKIDHKIWSWAKEKREAELEKCSVLCEQCHWNLHADLQRKPVEHGRASSYKSGCRCDACRNAHRIYQYEWQHGKNQPGPSGP